MGSQAPSSRFRKVQSFETDYAPTTITQYESERSGMQVIVADRKGPKINGYFTLATEIFDDSGAPHTLEHLIFMGSKSYQYKGLLDKLASRAYGTTNAWTAIDHTAYTLETAGWDGFAQILPVYLEHVILPTITDTACTTEVHHVDGEGNDAGVVYSEMQALQYTSTEQMDIKARHLLYPENVGFRYETGGMMEALRVLTPKRIREFHKTMYQPRNMAVVLVGEVDHDSLLEILDKFEESIKNDIPALDTPFMRPWIDSPQPPPLAKTVVETIQFPEEDESTGDLVLAFFGPSCVDVIETTALNVLLTYLCGSSVSILENVIVEKEELASSVSYWWDARPNSVIWLQPTGVETEKLEFVKDRVISLLKEVASKPLDMVYMKECIHREKRQVKFQAEGSESFYSTNIITDYLFGDRSGKTLSELSKIDEYDVLEKWTDEQWRTYLRKWLSDAHHIAVLGKPSLKLADKQKKEEQARIEKRKQELGPEGLEKRRKELDEAKRKNDVEIPTSLLEEWPIPSTDSIHFIESKTARSGLARKIGTPQNSAQKTIDNAPSGLPLFIQFEEVPTNFVHIIVHVSTAAMPVKLKPLLPIYCDNFFNTPINKEGKRVEFEQVVMDLERDTVSYMLRSGSKVGDSESFVISMQVEPEKYATAVTWIRALMFESIFDPVRIKAAITKQLADIPELKRDGNGMASEVEMAIHNEDSCHIAAKRALVKAVYLKRLKTLLEKEPETVLGWLEDLRRSAFEFSNLRVLVTANVGKLDNPVKTWDILTAALDTSNPIVNAIPKPHTFLNAEGQNPGSVGATLVPLTSIDSSYAICTTKGLTSWNDPRLPAIYVAVQYLETAEGPLWTAVRGNGLAYGVYFSREVDGGYIQFKVYRSPAPHKAIIAARDAIRAIVNGTTPLDKTMIEGAISQIVMGFADEQSTMTAAATQNYIMNVVRGLESDWNTDMLRKVREVTQEQIKSVMRELLLPAFEPGTSNIVVTCAPIMLEAIEKDLKQVGYKTQTKQLSDFYNAYGLETDPDEEEEEEEGDSDEEDESSEAGSQSEEED